MAIGREERGPRRRRPARGKRRAARVAASIVEHLPSGILLLQRDGDRGLRFIAANRTAIDMTGLARVQIIGQRVSDLIRMIDGDTEALDADLDALIGSDRTLRRDRVNVIAPACDGRVHSLLAFLVDREVVAVSLEDVTDRVVATAALHHQALHDPLTGLANRALFTDRLRHALSESRRTGRAVSLLLMDLDQFKEVNDALGHHHGDRLLIAVAARLRENLRECDTIARLGGDEFALLLTEGTGVGGALATGDKVVQLLGLPFEIDGLVLQMQASIGVAVFPDHGDDEEALTKRADAAMYKAKRGGGGVTMYDPAHDRTSVQRPTLASELRQAIELGELRLAYQPILELATRRVTRVEALVRWQHPRLGLLPPKEFVDLAELSGVIRPMTKWVIDRALHQAAEWQRLGVELGVSVNLSPRNLYEPQLVRQIVDLLSGLDLPGALLTVEIGESELTDDPRIAFDVIRELDQLGVSTSIDDFGTGYSSLGSLQEVPIREIKIDRSFVGQLDHSDAGALSIVRSIIDLGRNLAIDVVAEGVQTATSLTQLRNLGCRFAQGYHIGPPMSAGAVGLVAAATQTPASAETIDIRTDG